MPRRGASRSWIASAGPAVALAGADPGGRVPAVLGGRCATHERHGSDWRWRCCRWHARCVAGTAARWLFSWSARSWPASRPAYASRQRCSRCRCSWRWRGSVAPIGSCSSACLRSRGLAGSRGPYRSSGCRAAFAATWPRLARRPARTSRGWTCCGRIPRRAAWPWCSPTRWLARGRSRAGWLLILAAVGGLGVTVWRERDLLRVMLLAFGPVRAVPPAVAGDLAYALCTAARRAAAWLASRGSPRSAVRDGRWPPRLSSPASSRVCRRRRVMRARCIRPFASSRTWSASRRTAGRGACSRTMPCIARYRWRRRPRWAWCRRAGTRNGWRRSGLAGWRP